jgi:hypothetical protein
MFSSSYTKFERNSFNVTPIWDIVPALTYCAIFLGSTPMTEAITSGKYPGYKAYQQRVSMVVPWLTPVWGFVLTLRGKKEEIDNIVYGDGKIVKQE